MEEINKEIEGKSIERVKTEIKEVVEEVQPKKTRSEAQKRAFEKARAKRQANLEAKKEEQELDDWAESELQKEDPQPVIKPPPKKRGRPRKKKVVEEPPAPQYIAPPDPQLASGYGYQRPPQQFNPYQYWGAPLGVPPQQQQPQHQPVVNNYYYGMPPEPESHNSAEEEDNQIQESTPEVSFQEEEEVEYETYASPDPRLKFRFA